MTRRPATLAAFVFAIGLGVLGAGALLLDKETEKAAAVLGASLGSSGGVDLGPAGRGDFEERAGLPPASTVTQRERPGMRRAGAGSSSHQRRNPSQPAGSRTKPERASSAGSLGASSAAKGRRNSVAKRTGAGSEGKASGSLVGLGEASTRAAQEALLARVNAGQVARPVKQPRARNAALIVRVLDGENRPLRGVELRLSPASSLPPELSPEDRARLGTVLSGRSDSSGGFRFAELPGALAYKLDLSAPGFAPLSGEVVFVEAGAATEASFRLEGGEPIKGRVIDEQGRPLESVLLRASASIEKLGSIVSTGNSDQAGDFVLRMPPGSISGLRANKSGFGEARLDGVRAGSSGLVLTLSSKPGRVARGRVVDGDSGLGLSGFQINGEQPASSDGNFDLRVEDEKTYSFLLEGYRERSVVAPEEDFGEIRLLRSRDLHILVVASIGAELRPIPGLSVVTNRRTVSAKTGADGRALLPGLVDDEALVIEVKGDADYAGKNVTFGAPPRPLAEPLPPGLSAAKPLVIALESGSKELSALVVDRAGAPISGAQVKFGGRSALSDVAGRAKLTGLVAAQGSLELSHPRFSTKTVSVMTGPAVQQFTLETGTIFEGAVTRRGAAVGAGVVVELWAPRDRQPPLAAPLRSLTDESGRFRFENPEPGDWFVQVPSLQHSAEKVSLVADQRSERELAVQGRVDLIATILDADGKPHAGSTVYLHRAGDGYWSGLHAITSQGGEARFLSIRPGGWVLSILKSPVDPSAQQVVVVELPDEPVVRRRVRLPKLEGGITVTLTDQNGQPLAGVQVGAERLGTPHREILAGWGRTDTAGRFFFPRMGAGRYRIRSAWESAPVVFSEPLELAEGKQASLTLVRPKKPGLVLSGHLVSADGGPISGSFIFVKDAKGRIAGNYFSGLGRWSYRAPFRIDGLSPGAPVTIIATAWGHRSRELSLTLSASKSDAEIVLQRRSD